MAGEGLAGRKLGARYVMGSRMAGRKLARRLGWLRHQPDVGVLGQRGSRRRRRQRERSVWPDSLSSGL